jgi:hypothetical protein
MSRVQAVPERFRPVLSNLIDMIAGGDTAAMRASPAIRVGSGDPLLWVRDYPGEVISLPAEGWDLADGVQVAGQPDLWSVTIPLWTDAEAAATCRWMRRLRTVPKVLSWKSGTSTSCESRSCRGHAHLARQVRQPARSVQAAWGLVGSHFGSRRGAEAMPVTASSTKTPVQDVWA